MKILNPWNKIAVVIHTCDAYQWLWDGWRYYFEKYWDTWIGAKVYFASENIAFGSHIAIPICTGSGEWGERLHRILDVLPDEVETIFYMQEDFWLYRTLPIQIFISRYEQFKDLDMNAYRCCPNSKHFEFDNKISPYHFSLNSPYLISHQASFWKRDFFKNCVQPHENPWVNEKVGTKRLQTASIDPKIYFAPYNWYNTVCCKGKLTELGHKLNEQSKNLPNTD